LDRIKRFGLIAAVTALALLVPTRAASSDTPPPVIEVLVTLTDLPPAIVNVSVPEQTPIVNIELPETPAPVVNVDVALPEGLTQPTTVVVEPAPILPAEVIYQDRTVEVERIVEVASCLDYGDLPYFDLANALTRAFPGTLWSLNGSHYNGLTWLDDSPQPDMTAIIGGWLAHLAQDC
jgi:hypothetical protein